MDDKDAAGSGAAGGTLRDQAKVKTGNKDITKAVLASPLIIPWPNLPRNYQTAVMQEMPRLVPDSIAAYHTARSRCQAERKMATRKEARATAKAARMDNAATAAAGPSTITAPIAEPPAKPETLDHLVLGINESIKSLEHAIDDLKLQLLLMADCLNGTHLKVKPGSTLLPTAPPADDEQNTATEKPAQTSRAEASPPAFVIVPLHSISPQSLVAPIPQYAATYNSLVWQWGQLAKVVKTRLKEAEWSEVLGQEREEVRVVPLGRVEGELAAMVGLRRLACLAIRRSHPQLRLLEKILHKSVLHPPRHALTLPYQTSNLAVHSSEISSGGAPLPHVHYAPLTIKGITTSTPVDANSRKKKRLEEVRQKRVETKLKRKRQREGGDGGGKKVKKTNTAQKGKTK